MTGGRASLIWLALLAGGVGLFAGVWLLPQLTRVSEQNETLNRLETEGRQLAARIHDLTGELNELLAEPEEAVPEPVQDRGSDADARVIAEAAKRLQNVRLLAATQTKLEEAVLTIEELKARIGEMEASGDRLTEEIQLMAEAEQEYKDQLARSDRVVDAMRAELKGNSERLVKLETRNRKLRDDNKDVELASARSKKMVRDLENLYRRREDILTNIVRRYREVADEYRAVAMRINNPEEYGPTRGVDLSRIQNALTLADEDLRELRSLNTRASRIQRALAQ